MKIENNMDLTELSVHMGDANTAEARQMRDLLVERFAGLSTSDVPDAQWRQLLDASAGTLIMFDDPRAVALRNWLLDHDRAYTHGHIADAVLGLWLEEAEHSSGLVTVPAHDSVSGQEEQFVVGDRYEPTLLVYPQGGTEFSARRGGKHLGHFEFGTLDEDGQYAQDDEEIIEAARKQFGLGDDVAGEVR